MSSRSSISLPNKSIRRSVLTVAFTITLCAVHARAGVTVNPPQPITHIITVQPIRVQSSDGSISATVFGAPYLEEYIKEQIDVILAQSGINVEWMPLVDYRNDFALDGSPGNYNTTPRPGSHLQTILNDAPSPPKSADPFILNIYFVDIAPFFPRYSIGFAGGAAVTDANGIAVAISADLLTSYGLGGLDTIAGAVAHEIGHNLGLGHEPFDSDNLMAGGWSTAELVSEKLTPVQTATIFIDNFGTDGFEFLMPYVPPTQYSLWAEDYELDGAPGDDDDGDRIANVLEFMLDLDPTTPDNHEMPTPVWDTSGLTWTIAKESDALDDGLTYAIEVSSDGATWLPAGTTGSGSTIVTDNAFSLIVRLDAGSERKFMRLATDLSPPLLPGFRTQEPPEAGEDLLRAALPRISGCSPHGCGHGGGHP